MDFFERQDRARRSTKLLVLYFVLAVAFLILAIYLAVLLIFHGVALKTQGADGVNLGYWNPSLFAGVSLATLTIIFCGSVTKTFQLARGGSAVASMLGGRLLDPNTTDVDERKLLNVVEEMALASGVPVPAVYVMDDENGINAFAAGHTTSDAVVGVTRGCMKLLNRDELQGVIAHEFSHILNGDMRLNVRLIGIIFGIVCITVIGRILLRSGYRTRYHLGARNRGGNPLPILGLALIAIGWIGVLFGRLIQAAVSRQREFLADASAVQFTRNPDGIAGALKKIGGLAAGSRLESAHAEEASHMFFGNSLEQSFIGLMATHPPLTERIRAIDPQFDGSFPRVTPDQLAEPIAPAKAQRPPPLPFQLPGFPAGGSFPGGVIVPPIIAAGAVLPGVGRPSARHLQYAIELRNSFPPEVQEAAHSPLPATALVYAVLLNPDADIQGSQLATLGEPSSPTRREIDRLQPFLTRMGLRAKLPLIDLTLPALRRLSPAQFEEFRKNLTQFIEADREVDLFEYVLQKVIRHHLDPHFRGARKQVIQYYALKPLAPDCSILLSTLAHVGHNDPSAAEHAFRQGAQTLAYQAQAPLVFTTANQSDLEQVDAVLNRLSEAAPQIKKNVINACAQTVAADGVIQENEAELLRAIADTLDCPLPPFVQPG